MSIAIARATLNRAFAEANAADNEREKLRQAAEKGWRAAREAVYAVLVAYSNKPRTQGTVSAGTIANFEATTLDRPRGQPLTDGYSRALQILHGECFYEGSPIDVHAELKRVGSLIEQTEADMPRKGAKIGIKGRYR